MNVTEATRLLLKMEEEIRSRLCSNDNEPECEVHSSTGSNVQVDLQEHLNEICSLRDLFVKQSQTLSMIQDRRGLEIAERSSNPIPRYPSPIPDPDDFSASSILDDGEVSKYKKSFDETIEETTRSLDDAIFETLQEISPTCVSKLYPKKSFLDRDISKSLDFGEDSDMEPLFPGLDGTDSEIQAAIDEIRKEASQMDAVMALDQLKTLQSELEVTTKALQQRSSEAEDLRIQVKEMEDRVACLELERDLFKADASKLKEDLKTCVERMFDISCVVGDSGVGVFEENDSKTAANDRSIPPSISSLSKGSEMFSSTPGTIRRPYPALPASRPKQSTSSPMLFFSAPKESRNVVRRIPTASDPNPARRGMGETSRKATRNQLPQTVISQRDSIFRRNGAIQNPAVASAQSSRISTASRQVDNQSAKRQYRSFSLERRKPDEIEQEEKENRMCGMFRRRHSKRSNALKNNDIEIMRQQISQLHEMMKTSLSTSEKLRKRLAMISRYYEGIIRKLQDQIVESKADRKRIEVTLANQISNIDHEKRMIIMQLEMKLRKKEDELLQLRRMEI